MQKMTDKFWGGIYTLTLNASNWLKDYAEKTYYSHIWEGDEQEQELSLNFQQDYPVEERWD